MPEEVFFDEFGDFELAVGIVGDAVFGYVADLFLLELQVLQRILKVIEIHVLFYYIQSIDLNLILSKEMAIINSQQLLVEYRRIIRERLA